MIDAADDEERAALLDSADLLFDYVDREVELRLMGSKSPYTLPSGADGGGRIATSSSMPRGTMPRYFIPFG